MKVGKFPLGPIGEMKVIIKLVERKDLPERYYSFLRLPLRSCNGVSFKGIDEEDCFNVIGHYSFPNKIASLPNKESAFLNGGGGVMFLSKKDKKEK